MSFFIILNGKLNQHDFDYLDDITGRRLDATLAPGKRKVVRADESVNSWAIEIMSKNLLTLDPNESIGAAVELLRRKKIHHIPLVHDGALVGMVSDRDIMWPGLNEIDYNNPLEQFMSNIVLVCHEETPVDYLAHVFYRENINSMPIINDKNQLVGIVTTHDLLRWIYDQ